MSPLSQVLDAIAAERARQDRKFGADLTLPDVAPPVSASPLARAREVAVRHWLESADFYRSLCDDAFAAGQGSWAHVLLEEVAEAIEAGAVRELSNLRTELVQIAAVCVAWVEDIDRRPSPPLPLQPDSILGEVLSHEG